MGDFPVFPGRIVVEEREKALQTANAARRDRDTLWTDGSRLDSGEVDAAAVWCEEAHTRPLWTGNSGNAHHPIRRLAGWLG